MTLSFVFNGLVVYSEDVKPNKKQVVKERTVAGKDFNMIQKKKPSVPDVSFGADEPQKEELIQVTVKNEFDEEIRVKFDTNREYPIGPHEYISLGQRKPGKYTLTIYNKNGDFVDNLTRNIDNRNKFVLNKEIVSNSDKITGLSTGQKVAIGAGALGAATLGAVLLNMALEGNQQGEEAQYIPPPLPSQPLPDQNQIVQQPQPAAAPEQPVLQNNAVIPGGMSVRFLNTRYSEVTVIVEGIDKNPIGNGWLIMLAQPEQKPQPLMYNSEKISIGAERKIKIVLPSGLEIQRYGFELDVDSVDNSYVWVLK